MLILSEFDIQFHLPFPTPMIVLLHLHPALEPQLRAGNDLRVEQLVNSNPQDNISIPSSDYTDSFGNHCARFVAPAGHLKLSGSNTLDVEPNPDPIYANARQSAIEDLPSEALQFLLSSRYCEVDRFAPVAQDLFGSIPAGWARATAIRDWVHEKVIFNYNAARPTKTAMDVFTERVGVCRDFQHLAVTLSRCMNIPARYVTGYIGDIRMPYSGPGDFSAWYQVFLDGKWIDLDARHNYPRLGRILMATGRDAADVAITTSFGAAQLTHFYVESNEVQATGEKVARPLANTAQTGNAAQGTNAQGLPPNPNPAEVTTPTQTNGGQSSSTQTQAATS